MRTHLPLAPPRCAALAAARCPAERRRGAKATTAADARRRRAAARRPRRRRAPAAGKIQLVLQNVGGSPPFALAGRRFVVRGIVIPYVAGQTVKVSFYRDGRKVGVQTVSRAARRQRRRPVPRRLHEPPRAGSCRRAPRTTRRRSRPRSAGARAACASSTRTSAPAPRARRCGCCSPSWQRCTTRCR